MRINKRAVLTIFLSIIITIIIGAIVLFAYVTLIKDKNKVEPAGTVQMGNMLQNNTVNNNNLSNNQNNLQNSELNNINGVNENNEFQNNINGQITGDNPIVIIPDTEEPSVVETIATKYYYGQLDANAKIIYDGLKTNKSKLSSGTYTIDFDTKFNVLLNTENGEDKLNTAFQSAWDAFYYDNPDIFYLNINNMALITKYSTFAGITTYTVTLEQNNKNVTYLNQRFENEEQVKEAKKYVEGIKQQIVKATENFNDISKVGAIHNWIVGNVEYDTTLSRTNNSDIYGTLMDKQAVCEGYARTLKYFLDAVGVPCVIVAGTGTDSEDGTQELHAWNYVQIGNKWYAIDITWDDPIITGGGELTNELKMKYFMKGSDEFMKNHKEDGMLSEDSQIFKFPVIEKENYSN